MKNIHYAEDFAIVYFLQYVYIYGTNTLNEISQYHTFIEINQAINIWKSMYFSKRKH